MALANRDKASTPEAVAEAAGKVPVRPRLVSGKYEQPWTPDNPVPFVVLVRAKGKRIVYGHGVDAVKRARRAARAGDVIEVGYVAGTLF